MEVISSASKMMAGQYIVCWSADPDDPPPPTANSSLAQYMSYSPSVVKTVYQNARMRIPCSLTQKWYYVDGEEDKDCEFGRIFVAIAAPLANVTAGSSTQLLLRLRWVMEFQMPTLPPSVSNEGSIIYASADNYFTDSSGDWKGGKFLTFKWKEGGDITSFPGAQPKSLYKCTVDFSYYKTDGTVAVGRFAATANELQESSLPFLIPFASKDDAVAYIKSPTDSKLLDYYAPGNWIVPGNPAWILQPDKVELDLCLMRHDQYQKPTPLTATVLVHDVAAHRTNTILKNLVGKDVPNATLPEVMDRLNRLQFTGVEHLGEALSVFNYDPVRPSPSSTTSSFEEVAPVQEQQHTTISP